MAEQPPTHVRALEIGGSAARRLTATRRRGRTGIDRYRSADLAGRWDGEIDFTEAAAIESREPADAPLVVAIADEHVLYRWLTLPAVALEQIERMVEAQAEILLPGPKEGFAWGWQPVGAARDGHQRVLLCAARRDHLDRITGALPGDLAAITASGLAVAAGWVHFAADPGAQRTAIIDVAARHTSVIILDGHEVERVGVLEQGGDHWTEAVADATGTEPAQAEQAKREGRADAAAMDRILSQWSRGLGATWRSIVADLPAPAVQRCVLTGRSAALPHLADRASEALGVAVRRAEPDASAGWPAGIPFDAALTAAGAAHLRLETAARSIDLGGSTAAEPRGTGPMRRRVAWAAALLAGAILLLYGMDRFEARRLRGLTASMQTAEEGNASPARSLKIGRYLDGGAAPPLAILEQVSAAAPQGVLLSHFEYDRRGTVKVTAAGSPEQIVEYLGKLAESPLLTGVRPTSGAMKDKKWQSDIEARAAMVHRYAARPPVTDAEPEKKTPAPEGS